MTPLDWFLVIVGTLAALTGWRAGLVRGALGFIGFIVGAAIALFVIPDVLNRWDMQPAARAAIIIVSLALFAIIGQGIGAVLGAKAKKVVTWQPAHWLDSVLGATLGIAGFALVVWLVTHTLLMVPNQSVTGFVDSSRVVGSIHARVPDGAKDALARAESEIQSATMPMIAGGFFAPPPTSPPPSETQTVTPAVTSVLDSVVRVSGRKVACNSGATGSGYVSTVNHVTTNAHVVSGMQDVTVSTDDGDTYRGYVVAMDPDVDVAVVYVPGLPLSPIPTSTDGSVGVSGTVAGYPGGGDLTLVGAQITSEVSGPQAVGYDIYQSRPVSRDVFVLSADVEPGNSGGPLLSSDGRVLGLIFAKALEREDVGFALTAEEFRTLSREYGAATQRIDTGACAVG